MRTSTSIHADNPGTSWTPRFTVGPHAPSVKRLAQGSDVPVLEYRILRLSSTPDDHLHHCSGQIVGTNDLVGEQNPEHGVDAPQDAVAEIRLLPRLHRIDVCRTEDIDGG